MATATPRRAASPWIRLGGCFTACKNLTPEGSACGRSQAPRQSLSSVLIAALSVLFVSAPTWSARAADAERTPILFDTDIGTGIDDAFALGLILASPKIELRGVTTVGRDAEDRAWIVCRFLTHAGVKDVPVAWGRGEQPAEPIDWQIQYRRHPAVVWNRTVKPSKKSAVEV